MKIEKGIPIPVGYGNLGITSLMRNMEIGDSVFFPGRTSRQMSGIPSRITKQEGRKFTVRSRVENGVAGCRMWRIA